MSQLTRLEDKILKRICVCLRLGDLVTLRSVDNLLEEFLHRHPDVWTTGSSFFFPPNDASITDEYIRSNVPNIPRSYALREMQLINLPLTWVGFLWIFDHFAHSVDRIHVKASEQTLTDLARHLSIFAGNLAVLQHENKIPITFRQYAINHSEYENNMVQTDYMGRNNLKGLRRYLETLKLDDPPFEQLAELCIECTDPHSTTCTISSSSSVDSYTSIYHENNPIHQIYFITSFLAGGHPLSRQPRNNKRSREEEEEDYHDGTSTTRTPTNNSTSSSSKSLPVAPSSSTTSFSSSALRNNKYRRHDNNNYHHHSSDIHRHHDNNKNDTVVLPPPTASVHHTRTQPPLGYT